MFRQKFIIAIVIIATFYNLFAFFIQGILDKKLVMINIVVIIIYLVSYLKKNKDL